MATTTVKATDQEGGITNFAAGSFTSDGNATIVSLGFTPRYVYVINETDVITWEKIEGMAAANAIKTVTAGTTTVDTGSAILINNDGRTITLSATAVGTSKAISWIAQG